MVIMVRIGGGGPRIVLRYRGVNERVYDVIQDGDVGGCHLWGCSRGHEIFPVLPQGLSQVDPKDEELTKFDQLFQDPAGEGVNKLM